MQEILNIIYTNTLGVQKFISWISGGNNVFSIRISYLDLLVISFIALIYINFLLKTLKKTNVSVVDFILRTWIVFLIVYFVVGNPLSKDVGYIEGNAYTHFYFKKIEKADMDTARVFKSSYIIESPPSDNALFSKAGGMNSNSSTVYIDASDVDARFVRIGDAKSYEYDDSYAKAGITKEMFNANSGSGLFFSLQKDAAGLPIADPKAVKIKSCMEAGVAGAQCTDWWFVFDERKLPVKGIVKLKEDYQQPDGVTVADFWRVSFLNDFEMGYVSGNEAAQGADMYIIERSDLFYWRVMSMKDLSADKQGWKIALNFFITPNLYTLKLDRDISANSLSADNDGYSPEILKSVQSDFIKEKQRQCQALGKDSCTYADIYEAKSRSVANGKVNAFLSAYSLIGNGFSVGSDGIRRTVLINEREYLTFMGLYEALREKAARPVALERSFMGANFASSKNTMAFVTTEDGTEDGTIIRKAYPIGAFQQWSLYSQAYNISSADGIGPGQALLLAIYSVLFIVILLVGSMFPILLAYTFLN